MQLIQAAHFGLPTLGIALVSDSSVSSPNPTHEEVLAVVAAASANMKMFVRGIQVIPSYRVQGAWSKET